MTELILPNARYRDSYVSALTEFQAEGAYTERNLSDLRENFETYVTTLKNQAVGKDLPNGYVPHTEFWIVDGDEYIGRFDVRHELNDYLQKIGGHIGYDVRPSKRRHGYGTAALQLGLKKAKELGLKNLLLTCDVNNIGSNKIIRKNGGVLTDTQKVAEGKPEKNYYSFDISK